MNRQVFEDAKKGVRAGIATAVEKAEELIRISRIKLDIAGLKRNINATFRDLGNIVYDLVSQGKGDEVGSEEEVKRLIEKVKMLQFDLKEKEEEIEIIKAEKEKQKGDQEQKI